MRASVVYDDKRAARTNAAANVTSKTHDHRRRLTDGENNMRAQFYLCRTAARMNFICTHWSCALERNSVFCINVIKKLLKTLAKQHLIASINIVRCDNKQERSWYKTRQYLAKWNANNFYDEMRVCARMKLQRARAKKMFPVLAFEIRVRLPSKLCKNCWLNQNDCGLWETRRWFFVGHSKAWSSPQSKRLFRYFSILFHSKWISLIFVAFLFPIAVNSEANARRITMVESCFGSSGEVS